MIDDHDKKVRKQIVENLRKELATQPDAKERHEALRAAVKAIVHTRSLPYTAHTIEALLEGVRITQQFQKYDPVNGVKHLGFSLMLIADEMEQEKQELINKSIPQ